MIPSTIEIKTKIEEDFVKILADETKLHQVIVNMINNASQSMESEGGLLTIGLEKVNINKYDTKYYSNLDTGDYIKIIISDTGTGMDESVIERIFDPFFTTKEVGKGTGLGLSVAHGIINDHNGEIVVNSQPGEGTEFDIFLPIIESKHAEEITLETMIQGNQENILVVDDEIAVARTLSKMLKLLGFNGIPVNDPNEAIELYRKIKVI